MVAKELWSVARDKKSLPVVKISYLDRVKSGVQKYMSLPVAENYFRYFDRVSSLESKNIWLLRSYGSVARDKKSLPVLKISYLDRVSSLESKNIWFLRSYSRLLGTKSHFRL